MKLKTDIIWSPNLVPETSGFPPDIYHFQLHMKVHHHLYLTRSQEYF